MKELRRKNRDFGSRCPRARVFVEKFRDIMRTIVETVSQSSSAELEVHMAARARERAGVPKTFVQKSGTMHAKILLDAGRAGFLRTEMQYAKPHAASATSSQPFGSAKQRRIQHQ